MLLWDYYFYYFYILVAGVKCSGKKLRNGMFQMRIMLKFFKLLCIIFENRTNCIYVQAYADWCIFIYTPTASIWKLWLCFSAKTICFSVHTVEFTLSLKWASSTLHINWLPLHNCLSRSLHCSFIFGLNILSTFVKLTA